MHLKSEADIKAALAGHKSVDKDRKEILVATIRSTRPEKMGELHTVFTSEGGLSKAELSFYNDIVVVEGNEGDKPAEIVQGITAPDEATAPLNGSTPKGGK